jgi:hypothetical protein
MFEARLDSLDSLNLIHTYIKVRKNLESKYCRVYSRIAPVFDIYWN